MKNKNENNNGFWGIIIKILIGLGLIVGLFYLYLALTK